MNCTKHARNGFTLVEIMIVVVIIALLAALAIPVWQKIRLRTMCSLMDNDARLLAAAAQQYFMENNATAVPVGYVAGAITGPLAGNVHLVGRDYSSVTDPMILNATFVMAHPLIPAPRTYSAEGQYQP